MFELIKLGFVLFAVMIVFVTAGRLLQELGRYIKSEFTGK